MRLVQVAFRVADLESAVAFYVRLLGSEPSARLDPPGLAFFDVSGVRLMLSAASEPGEPAHEAARAVAGRPSPAGDGATVYLDVGSVHATLDRVRSFAEVVAEPHVIFRHDDDTLGPAGHDEWQAFVRDPDGHVVGLVGFAPPGL